MLTLSACRFGRKGPFSSPHDNLPSPTILNDDIEKIAFQQFVAGNDYLEIRKLLQETLRRRLTNAEKRSIQRGWAAPCIAIDSGVRATKILLCHRVGHDVETQVLAQMAPLKNIFGNGAPVDEVEQFTLTVKAALAEHKPLARCFAGITAWYDAALSAETARLENHFAIHLPEFKILWLDRVEEAHLKATAVKYVAERCDLEVPGLQITAGSSRYAEHRNFCGTLC